MGSGSLSTLNALVLSPWEFPGVFYLNSLPLALVPWNHLFWSARSRSSMLHSPLERVVNSLHLLMVLSRNHICTGQAVRVSPRRQICRHSIFHTCKARYVKWKPFTFFFFFFLFSFFLVTERLFPFSTPHRQSLSLNYIVKASSLPMKAACPQAPPGFQGSPWGSPSHWKATGFLCLWPQGTVYTIIFVPGWAQSERRVPRRNRIRIWHRFGVLALVSAPETFLLLTLCCGFRKETLDGAVVFWALGRGKDQQ